MPSVLLSLITIQQLSKEDNGRTVNHHGGERDADPKENEPTKGNIIKVLPSDLISRNEKVEFEARKQFYESLRHTEKKTLKIKKLQFVGQTVFPILITSFTALYFVYGFSQINY